VDTTPLGIRYPESGDDVELWNWFRWLAQDADALLTDADAAGNGPTGIIAWHSRESSTATTTTTEIGAIRLDNVPVVAGRCYRVWTNQINLGSTVATDQVIATVRYNEGGTASNASTALDYARWTVGNATHTDKRGISKLYRPSGSANVSFWLGGRRANGTGNASFFANAGEPLELYIEDLGVVPAESASGV